MKNALPLNTIQLFQPYLRHKSLFTFSCKNICDAISKTVFAVLKIRVYLRRCDWNRLVRNVWRSFDARPRPRYRLPCALRALVHCRRPPGKRYRCFNAALRFHMKNASPNWSFHYVCMRCLCRAVFFLDSFLLIELSSNEHDINKCMWEHYRIYSLSKTMIFKSTFSCKSISIGFLCFVLENIKCIAVKSF